MAIPPGDRESPEAPLADEASLTINPDGGGPTEEAEPVEEEAAPVDSSSDGGHAAGAAADAELLALEAFESVEVAAADGDRAALASHAASAGGSHERADGFAALALAEALRTSSGDMAATLLRYLSAWTSRRLRTELPRSSLKPGPVTGRRQVHPDPRPRVEPN